MMSKFSLMMPMTLSQNPKGYEGFIKLQEKVEYIKILSPNYPSTENMHVSGTVSLMLHLQNSNLKPASCQTVEEYLIKLQRSKVSEDTTGKINEKKESFDLYSEVIGHLEILGWENVTEISENFSSVTLHIVDEKQRKTYLKVKLLPDYPNQSPRFEAEFPYSTELFWNPSTHLVGVYKQWKAEITKLQPFWDVLDSIDGLAYVIDPENPTRKQRSRRIMLENFVTVHLTISVSHPYSLPQWQFLGPASKVESLHAKMVENFNDWNVLENPVRNLENILELAIIDKSCKEDQLEDWNMECAVCYSLHLEDKLADIHCESCQKKFHLNCLLEWLRSLSTSRQSIQMIRGDCPHCSKPISCKVAKH